MKAHKALGTRAGIWIKATLLTPVAASIEELDGQTTGFLTVSQKGVTDLALWRNVEDPFVVIDKDPELGGVKRYVRFSQAKRALHSREVGSSIRDSLRRELGE